MAVPITAAMQNQIAQNYIAILGRNPEAGGFNFWVNTYADAGGTPAALTSITNGFGNSAEFRGTYGGLSTEAAIALMYQNVLLRAADAGGLAYWTGIANNLIAKGETISNAYAQTGAQMIYTASSNGSSDSAGINARTAAAVAAGQTGPTAAYTLTTGIDTFGNTGSGAQLFNAADGTFTSLDTLTGGSSTADRLNIASTAAYTANPAGATVTNIENVNFSLGAGGAITTAAGSGFTGVTNLGVTSSGNLSAVTAAAGTAITVTSVSGANALAINGGSSVALTQTGALTGANITIGATTASTGAMTVTNTASTAGGTIGNTITTTGGTTVNITSNISNTTAAGALAGNATVGAIGVNGTATTTAVTVAQTASVGAAAAVANVANTSNAVVAKAGIANAAVTIQDATAIAGTAASSVGTITAVTLSNYGASTISSNALTTLTLSNSTQTGVAAAGTVAVTYGLTAGNPTALALNLGGGSLGVLTLNGTSLATVNVNMTANTTLAGITDTALRTVNLSGSGVLTLTAVNTAITSIVNTSAAAGLSADVSALTGLTSLNFASTSAANTITLNAITQSYTGGTGVDTVTIAADATKAITGGSGTDVLVLSGTAATYTAANTVANVTGFETLRVTNAGGGTYDMSVLTGFSNIQVRVAGSTNTFTKVAAGTGLELQTGTTAVTYQTSDTTGATGTVNVTLKASTAVTAVNGGGTAGFTTTALTLQDANGVGIGRVNINADASVFGGLHTITTLTNSALSNLAITGSGSLSIGAAATNSTTLTISDNGTGNTANNGGTADGIVTLTSTGDVLGNLSYSGTHDFTIGSLNGAAVNQVITNANTSTTATTGVLTIGASLNAAGGANSTTTSLTLNGAINYTGVLSTTAAATVSAATNNAVVNLTMAGATGIKTITLGNGANIVVTGAAKDVITVGTGANTITGAADADAITLGAGHTTVNRLILNAVAGTSSDSTQVVVAGNGNDTGADVYTNVNLNTDVFRVVATTGTFNQSTNTVIGTAGATADGTAASFTTSTGLIYVDGSVATFDAGDIAVTFASPSAALTAANFRAMVQYDITTVTGANNVVVTGVLNDVLRSTTQAGTNFDTITGGSGSDNFVFATRANALNASATGNTTAAYMDRVTDIVVGTDTVTLGTGANAFGAALQFTAATVVNVNTITALGDQTYATFAVLAAAVETARTGVASTAATAQAYVVTTGTITTATGFSNKTFLVINDDTSAIAGTDTWIDITGVNTTTLTAGTFAFGAGGFIA